MFLARLIAQHMTIAIRFHVVVLAKVIHFYVGLQSVTEISLPSLFFLSIAL